MAEDKVMVRNLTNNDVVYIDNNGGVSSRIVFHGQQEMPISKDLLDRMRYDIGGSTLVRDYLSVKDEAFREEIGVPEDQIEYDYKQEDVIKLLKDNNIDAIADALDFGPLGIKEMIVDEAVMLPINNRDLMVLIYEKTGRNIELMIKNQEELMKAKAEADEPEKAINSKRRVAVKSKEEIAEIAAANVARRTTQKESE